MVEEFKSIDGRPAKLAIYMAYCDSLERNIDRRYATNRFYVTILAGFGAAFGFLLAPTESPDPMLPERAHVVLSAALFVISISWFFQVLRFRELSQIKFETAMKMEKDLGIAAIGLENEALQTKSSFIEFTQIELILPLVSIFFAIWAFLVG